MTEGGPEQRAEIIRLLVNDALEACGEKGAEASMLLVDAALSLTFTRLGPQGMQEAVGLLTNYMTQQAEAVASGHLREGGA